MFAKSVFITGCNRGIGLELVKHLADRTQHLFAACRKPDEADELKKLAEVHNHLIVLELDVTDQKQIEACVATISEVVGDDGLNCLINNAGYFPRVNLETVTSEILKRTYAINTIAPAMIVKACLPLLRKASAACSHGNMSVSRSAILNMSSKMASITDNTSGGSYAYRMSKAALNMLTKNLSIELKADHILAVILHPGWVQTDMGGPNALISTTKSVEEMLKMTSGFTEKDSGAFYGWNGENIPW